MQRALPPASAMRTGAVGYMLGTPSIQRYSSVSQPRAMMATSTHGGQAWSVRTRLVRTISRKDQASRSGSSASLVAFFEEHPLITAKRADFEWFCHVLRWMEDERHLSEAGLRDIAQTTELMNRRGRSRYLESSEAIRQPAPTDVESKIWS